MNSKSNNLSLEPEEIATFLQGFVYLSEAEDVTSWAGAEKKWIPLLGSLL